MLYKLGIGVIALVLLGQGCFGGGSSSNNAAEPVVLRYWRVFDGEDTMRDIIAAYEAQHPNVQIEYRRLLFDEYEEELIRALAEDRGPDLFSIQNTKIREFSNLIEPMPPQVTVSEQQVRGGLQREVVLVNTTKPTLNTRQLSDRYVDQVLDDIFIPAETEEGTVDVVVGAPLALDTMALYFNKDLLSAAGIPVPPETWTEFQTQVTALTTFDAEGNVDQSGAAIGTGNNVERSADLLSLIMMQAGVQMVDERGRVEFGNSLNVSGERTTPAIDALTFYTDFANPVKEVYTWNDGFSSSFEAFASGQTAFFFGYAYHDPLIQAAAPRLNYGVTKMPQIAGSQQRHFANYWIETVADNSEYTDWAWDFLLFATSEEQVPSYLEEAKKPTAHKRLIGSQLDNELLGIFAEQVLLADNWYTGTDWDRAEAAMIEMMNTFLTAEDPADVINLGQRKVSQTY